MYMYVGQIHIHGLYRQFATYEEPNSHRKCIASPRLTTHFQRSVRDSGQLHGKLSVLTCYVGHEMCMLY